MVSKETPCIKGTGSSTEQKPAAIVYYPPDGRDPRVGAATHHIVTSDEEVHVYLGDRRDGIDSTLPLDRCEIHRSERGRETFGAGVEASAGDRSGSSEDGDSDPHADSEKELVTDGGRPRKVVVHCDYCTAGMSVKPETDTPDQGWKCKQCWQAEQAGAYDRMALDIIEDTDVEPGDRVEYDGLEWVFVHYCMDHHTTLVPVGLVARDETVERPVDVRELDTVEDSSDDPYNSYDPVSDGHAGDVDVQAGDVVTVRDEDRRSDPGPWKVKDIQCGEATLWSSMQPMRYEPVEDLVVVEKAEDTVLPHSVPDQNDGDDSDPELVTDGGTRIESGVVVSHSGARYRVARVGEGNVELYRLGSQSFIAPLSEVDVVPGTVAVNGGDR